MSNKGQIQPPPAQGRRLEWQVIPAQLRQQLEVWLGSPIIQTVTQTNGFSPGVAVRLQTADGQRLFVKAIGPEPNPHSPQFHRQELKITALLPDSAPVPRLRWSVDDVETGWVMLAFDEIDGAHPAQPWEPDELNRVLDAVITLNNALTPSPLTADQVPSASGLFTTTVRGWEKLQENPLPGLDAWSTRHLDALVKIEATAGEAVDGNTLLHLDLRADNILLSHDRVWIVDWPHACIGAPWVDLLCMVPSVTMQGGPLPEDVMDQHPAVRAADFDAVTAGIVAMAGMFIQRSLQPPPPGLPTVRQFQAAQGAVTIEWLSRRLGWQ